MNEVVRLAIGGPVAIGARASATLTDLLASSGISVAHTGSVVLDWPSQTLPFEAAAWDARGSAEADPIAFAHHHLTARSTTGVWANPVDAIRMRVSDWVAAERLRITLAVAGFTSDQLDITLEERQLLIRGRQTDDAERHYLHRGIAARQFQRAFLLAEGMEVLGADLKNGLLCVDLARPEPERIVKKIGISVRD
jgi:HSP20 family molecular chaperone IbpA